ncbi:hypothetical protein AcW1_000347 [Taiwanofungus camphoratus]|nr:hypothetical protein AcW2_001158 [Antrodia cinnamomea]KAI0961204.1 hypothetical protein AcV7_000367 [Antrodia cinnamomea]KAI0963201.1 hypothetical protein AcW1_000347 [Antrodia cinnamomea]
MNLAKAPSILRRPRLQHIRLHAAVSRPRTSRSHITCRSYATHQDPVTASSLLSKTLDQKRRNAQREEYVGPFQLGLISPTPRGSENIKKWSELSTAGKVVRTTARTSNFVVILVGAGLSAVLIYALTSELFSKNSPTVLYGQACEKITSSARLAKFLQDPLVFHNNPPSPVRPRHRNHQVSSQLVVDASGREHMLLHFYVEGRPPGSGPSQVQPESYVDSVVHWSKDIASSLSEMTIDEFVEKVKAHAESTLEVAKQLFKYLSGDPIPPSQPSQPVKQDVKEEKEQSGWTSGLLGLFSGLRGSTRSPSEARPGLPDGKIYTEGEVHADLVMVCFPLLLSSPYFYES